ncbi:MAG: hypothetical protein C7B45_12360 [Sulfobacillus acidophilus]|uniref:Uncharacterized protein n=1 Tax=Sulfobacillus acidophilus TaxID=53633 RepID=A0A2T2WFL1_9FIRM|nr:MAG: hypothetical protein C7B45_12360 [Sulfobacillus acidophilus]
MVIEGIVVAGIATNSTYASISPNSVAEPEWLAGRNHAPIALEVLLSCVTYARHLSPGSVFSKNRLRRA